MKYNKTIPLFLSLALFSASLSACSVKQEKGIARTEQQVLANTWYQTSGEAKALYYQGYNIGKLQLDAALMKETIKKPAIVLDLDETVLDNSPYQAMTVKEGKPYPYQWDEWVKQAEAQALPGALSFLQYANQRDVSIYYISNRDIHQFDATLHNLQKIGAPQAEPDHLLLREDKERGKEDRRKWVAKNYEILLFFGDQLSDYTGFDKKNGKDRNQTVEDMRAQFGETFILFPNPMYGDWERALYQYDDTKLASEKENLRKNALQSFQIKK
ncbi:5'-nucleotidase, lipoprotein e(P4) family [Bacillus cereus]